jgi:hypothetical protein
MTRRELTKQGRRVVIVEGHSVLDKLVATGISHGNNSTDHVDNPFFSRPDTQPSLQPPPARSSKSIMSVQLNPPNSLGFRRMFRCWLFFQKSDLFCRTPHEPCQTVVDHYKQQHPASGFQSQDNCSQGCAEPMTLFLQTHSLSALLCEAQLRPC